jgi:large subunit ribosomal protein L29
MKQSEINGLSPSDIEQKLGEERSTYAELRRMHGMSPIDNPSQITKSRKIIARLITALNNKES